MLEPLGMTRAYPPAWFTGRLVSLATRWDELNTRRRQGNLAGPLKIDPKSRMRGPHVRFCERRGGAILCAYSTAGPAPAAHFPLAGKCDLAVAGDPGQYSILEIRDQILPGLHITDHQMRLYMIFRNWPG